MRIAHYIQHRVNSLEGLAKTDSAFGVEVDVRYHENEVILEHDPFEHHHKKPVHLKEFAAQYKNKGPLILNLKTEGIEKTCIEIMNQFHLNNWFFLDMSMPYFVRYAEYASMRSLPGFSPQNLAVRFSEKEPIEYALAFKNQATWLWVDCFTTLPINSENFETLSQYFKICLVSPELQGHPMERIQEFKKLLGNRNIEAVCSKRIDLWQK